MITATTAAAVLAAPLTLLGAIDVDSCSGESCGIRPNTTTTL